MSLGISAIHGKKFVTAENSLITVLHNTGIYQTVSTIYKNLTRATISKDKKWQTSWLKVPPEQKLRNIKTVWLHRFACKLNAFKFLRSPIQVQALNVELKDEFLSGRAQTKHRQEQRVHNRRATSLACNWRDKHHRITSQGTTMTSFPLYLSLMFTGPSPERKR